MAFDFVYSDLGAFNRITFFSVPGDPCEHDSHCSEAFDGSFCDGGFCSCLSGFRQEGDKCTLSSK